MGPRKPASHRQAPASPATPTESSAGPGPAAVTKEGGWIFYPVHYERHRPEQTTLYRLVLAGVAPRVTLSMSARAVHPGLRRTAPAALHQQGGTGEVHGEPDHRHPSATSKATEDRRCKRPDPHSSFAFRRRRTPGPRGRMRPGLGSAVNAQWIATDSKDRFKSVGCRVRGATGKKEGV